MEFKEALKKLGIEEYGERIFNSNSHGELGHLHDYIVIAENFDDVSWFKPLLDNVVKLAEKTSDRPDSVFQHIIKILQLSVNMTKLSAEKQ